MIHDSHKMLIVNVSVDYCDTRDAPGTMRHYLHAHLIFSMHRTVGRLKIRMNRKRLNENMYCVLKQIGYAKD